MVQFVYDLDRSGGKLALRAVRGTFRFVTGSGRKDGYKIMTGVGTIGVRGTSLRFSITGPTPTLSRAARTAMSGRRRSLGAGANAD